MTYDLIILTKSGNTYYSKVGVYELEQFRVDIDDASHRDFVEVERCANHHTVGIDRREVECYTYEAVKEDV